MSVIGQIALRARDENAVWAAAIRDAVDEREVFGPLAGRFALGVETIYEAFLVHYGTPRVFNPATTEEALLLGDYLYAAGLCEVCREGDVQAVALLAELITHASASRARGVTDDGALWLSASRRLGGGGASGGEGALLLHAELAA